MTNGEENECHGGESVWLWVFFCFCLVLFGGGDGILLRVLLALFV